MTVRLIGSIRRNPIKFATAIFALVASLGGAITAGPKIEDWWDTYYYATRGMARETAAAIQTAIQSKIDKHEQDDTSTKRQLLNAIRDGQIEQAEGKLVVTNNGIQTWKNEYQKAQKLNDPQSMDLATKQIFDLESTSKKLEAQIKTLNKLRHPNETNPE